MAEEIKDKTFYSDLEEEIVTDGLAPFRSLISLTEDMGEDMANFRDIMEIVFKKVEQNIQEVFKLTDRQIGIIRIQRVNYGEYLDFEGKRYSSLQRFRAFIAPPGGE